MLHLFKTWNITDINFNIFTSQPPATTLQICDKLMEFYILLLSND